MLVQNCHLRCPTSLLALYHATAASIYTSPYLHFRCPRCPTCTTIQFSATIFDHVSSMSSLSSCISTATSVIIIPRIFWSPHQTIFHRTHTILWHLSPMVLRFCCASDAAIYVVTEYLPYYPHQPCHIFCHCTHYSASTPVAVPHLLLPYLVSCISNDTIITQDAVFSYQNSILRP